MITCDNLSEKTGTWIYTVGSDLASHTAGNAQSQRSGSLTKVSKHTLRSGSQAAKAADEVALNRIKVVKLSSCFLCAQKSYSFSCDMYNSVFEQSTA